MQFFYSYVLSVFLFRVLLQSFWVLRITYIYIYVYVMSTLIFFNFFLVLNRL
jgi:hypothetical protein